MRVKSIKWPSLITILTLSLLLLTMVFTPIVQAETPQDTAPSDAYNYPVKPGMAEWKVFTSLSEKIEACQIPEDILKNMSTKGLVETVLKYPLLLNFRAFTDLQYGFDQISSYFNGLKELYNRKDAGTELLARYSNMDAAAFKDEWTDLQKGLYAMSFEDIGMQLAQEPILANLTPAQYQELTAEIAKKSQIMQNNTYVYGKLNSVIISFLVEKASNRQYSERGTPTTVYTPVGSPVSATQQNPNVYPAGDEFSDALKAAYNTAMDAAYPYASRQRSATNMYVCHTYAWYSQSPDTTIVIVAPNQATFWNDGSYDYDGTYPSALGQKVRYIGTDHSAILYDWYGHYILKWAYYGLYIHYGSDCPFVPTALYYYSP